MFSTQSLAVAIELRIDTGNKYGGNYKMLSQSAKNLLRDQNGFVLIETLLAVLVLPLLSFGIPEFAQRVTVDDGHV